MIDIKSDKERVIRNLQELEFELSQGNISKRTYNSQKRELETKLETIEAADRIKRLQGKGEAEKPLEYWTEKKEEEKERQAKEELMKKYITSSSPSYPRAKTGTNGKQRKAALYGVLGLIFIIGVGFGVFLMKVPSEASAVPMTINQSAFPTINNTTNMTNTTSSTNITQSSSTSSRTNTPSTNTPGTGTNTPTKPTTPKTNNSG